MTLVEMGRRFHERAQFPYEFDERGFLDVMAQCEQQGGLFQTDRGFIAGTISPVWFSPENFAAVELAWWSEDGKGAYLLRQFEGWAKQSGAKEVRMTTIPGLGKAERLMQLKGYRAEETSWTKAI